MAAKYTEIKYSDENKKPKKCSCANRISNSGLLFTLWPSNVFSPFCESQSGIARAKEKINQIRKYTTKCLEKEEKIFHSEVKFVFIV